MGHFDGESNPQTEDSDRFVRQTSQFRNWIRSDHSSPFAPEADRYHLYVSYACPWAHRTLIARELLGLHDIVTFSVVDPFMGEAGWRFSRREGCIPDTVNGVDLLRELYELADSDYEGRWTVPVLWDKKTGTIVNNESREILRMMATELRALSRSPIDLSPTTDRRQIDETMDWLYDSINDGVYRVGFARSQEAYDEAIEHLFDGLELAERRLAEQRFLCGSTLTEADICLFTTLYRFEPVYAIHFKCTKRPLSDYPNLIGFLRDVYQIRGIAATCNLEHVKEHYYRSHPGLNPRRIVPQGPPTHLHRPPERERLGRKDGNPLLLDSPTS